MNRPLEDAGVATDFSNAKRTGLTLPLQSTPRNGGIGAGLAFSVRQRTDPW